MINLFLNELFPFFPAKWDVKIRFLKKMNFFYLYLKMNFLCKDADASKLLF